ncbi:MAG TPA: GntR family transcriptional regulator [Alphaproteobacteria bacterium]|nr:GntR family transcriptional regulator [Alphaproteobacteria bacterium]
MKRARSSTSSLLAQRIVELAAERGWPAGHMLREVALAEAFGVSRSPVRAALELLARSKTVTKHPNRGFALNAAGEALLSTRRALQRRSSNVSYMQIAADRLAGRLPEQVTETLLQQRYRLGRSELGKLLTRMAQEGWIERSAGYGWTFLPTLTSPESHDLSYRFRMAIEPAALLQPTFRIDRAAFARCRDQQTALVEGRIREITSAELFEAGSSFHEMLVQCANNAFFTDALKRVNRLRRLIEYRAMLVTAHFVHQAREHLEIMTLIEGGDRAAAAALLGRHLDIVRAVKLRILEEDEPTRRGKSGAEARDRVAHIHF